MIMTAEFEGGNYNEKMFEYYFMMSGTSAHTIFLAIPDNTKPAPAQNRS